MSYSSLARQNMDGALMIRIDACGHQEAIENPTAAATDFGATIRANEVSPSVVLGWYVVVATEAAYEFAENSQNPNPGGDPSVITDADILAAVQANWPAEWPLSIAP